MAGKNDTAKAPEQALQEKLCELENKNAGLQYDINALAADKAVLLAELEDLKSAKAASDEMAEQMMAQIAAMASKPAEVKSSVSIRAGQKEKPALPGNVEADGKTISFLKPFAQLDGRTYTANEIAVSPELVERILAIEGQKIIQVLESEEA